MRQTKTVQFNSKDRDEGKRYLITEMPAEQAEEWAMRALLAISQSGIVIPFEALQNGWAGLMQVGIESLIGIAFADAKLLTNQLMDCVQYHYEPSNLKLYRPLSPDQEDIEEVITRIKLKEEVLTLHTGFSVAAYLRKRAEDRAAKISASPDT